MEPMTGCRIKVAEREIRIREDEKICRPRRGPWKPWGYPDDLHRGKTSSLRWQILQCCTTWRVSGTQHLFHKRFLLSGHLRVSE